MHSNKVMTSARKNVIIITGGNAGLGYQAAKSLCSTVSCDSIIVLACRNVEAANQAADSIAKETKCDRNFLLVLPEKCDLSDQESVRTYVKALKVYLKENSFRIKILVNNAGVGGNSFYTKNKAGHDNIFATNHLGHFLLTILLLPYVDERIINVGSEVHNGDKQHQHHMPDIATHYPTNEAEYESLFLRGEPIEGENAGVSGGRRYARSKTCNIFFTNELARRLSNAPVAFADENVIAAEKALPGGASCTLPNAKNIKVVTFNPGLMLDSDFAKNLMNSRFVGCFAKFMIPVIKCTPLGKIMRPVSLSGLRLARLTMGEFESNTSATYISDEAPEITSTFTRSLVAVTKYQQEVWDISIKWTGITNEELKEAGLLI